MARGQHSFNQILLRHLNASGEALMLGFSFNVMVAAFVMLSCLLAAANALDPARGPRQGNLSVRNDIPHAKLFVQCDSDIEHHPPHMVLPNEVDGFLFRPYAHQFWICSVYTAVPAHFGRFLLYSRELSLQSCTPTCEWIANKDGIWSSLTPGSDPTLLYHWLPEP